MNREDHIDSDLDKEHGVKPCPFCACGVNIFYATGEHPSEDGWCVECKNMGCILPRIKAYPDHKTLIRDWNERRSKPL